MLQILLTLLIATVLLCVINRPGKFIVSRVVQLVRSENAWAAFLGAFALETIATGTDAHRDACAAAGAIPALVGALGRHAGEARVCRSASGALGIIAATRDAHRDACVAAGAAPALVGALVAQANDGYTVRVICGAVVAVVQGAPGDLQAARAAAFVAAGALDTLEQFAAAADGIGDEDVVAWYLAHVLGNTIDVVRNLPPRRLFLATLPPQQLAARLASCFECWNAKPRRECPRREAAAGGAPPGEGVSGGGGGGGHDDPFECPVCREGESAKLWCSLECGHLFHERCLMEWAATETRGARAAAALPSHTAAHCPIDRCVMTRVVPPGAALLEGALLVDTPVLSPPAPPP